MKTFRGMFLGFVIGLAGLSGTSGCGNGVLDCNEAPSTDPHCGAFSCNSFAAALSNGKNSANQDSFWSCKTNNANKDPLVFKFFDDGSMPDGGVWAVGEDCKSVHFPCPPDKGCPAIPPPALFDVHFVNDHQFEAMYFLGLNEDAKVQVSCQKTSIFINLPATIHTSSFIELAKAADCAEITNKLYAIDQQLVFWNRAGDCPDAAYAQTLFGGKVDQVLCEAHDSIAGPVIQCLYPQYQALFDTITSHSDQPNLGLGSSHTVVEIAF